MLKRFAMRVTAVFIALSAAFGACMTAGAEKNEGGVTVVYVDENAQPVYNVPDNSKTDVVSADGDSDTGRPLTVSEFNEIFGTEMPYNDVGDFTASEYPGEFVFISADNNDDAGNLAAPEYNYSNKYLYERLTAAERTFYSELTAACERFMYSKENFTWRLNSSGVAFLPYGTSYSSINRTRAILIIQLFYYSNPQYYFLRPGCTWQNGYIAPNIITDFYKYSARKSCKSAIDSVTRTWMRSINKLTDPVEKESYIIEQVAKRLKYDYKAAEQISSGRITDGYDQSIAGALYKKKPVCAAYSQTVSYFCNAAGLQCFCVSSKGHQWNVVKIFSNWYQLDVTWYDTSSTEKAGRKWLNKSYAAFNSQDPNGHHIYNTNTWSYIAPPDCKYSTIQYPDPTGYDVMVKGGSVYKGAGSYDEIVKFIDRQKNEYADYVITFNTTAALKTMKFPKYASSLTLNSANGARVYTNSTSLSPKCSLTINCSVTNAKGKSLSIKIPKDTVLTIGKTMSGLSSISGTKTSELIVKAGVSAKTISGIGCITVMKGGTIAVKDKGKLTAAELYMEENANIILYNGAQMKVTGILSGTGTPKITMHAGCKPIDLSAKTVSGRIYLTSETYMVGKQAVKAKKVDPNTIFDVSGLAPEVKDGTYKYRLYVKSGKATVEPFMLSVNGKSFAYWNDLMDYIDKSASGECTVRLLGDYRMGKSFRLPSRKFIGKLTIDGNSHEMLFDNDVKAEPLCDLTLKSILLVPDDSLTIRLKSGLTLYLTGVKATSYVKLDKSAGGKVSGSILYI